MVHLILLLVKVRKYFPFAWHFRKSYYYTYKCRTYMESQNIKPTLPQDEHIVENKELHIWEALIPVFILVGMLAYNVFIFGNDSISGSNQFILLLGGAVAAVVGFFNKVTFAQMMEEVA